MLDYFVGSLTGWSLTPTTFGFYILVFFECLRRSGFELGTHRNPSTAGRCKMSHTGDDLTLLETCMLPLNIVAEHNANKSALEIVTRHLLRAELLLRCFVLNAVMARAKKMFRENRVVWEVNISLNCMMADGGFILRPGNFLIPEVFICSCTVMTMLRY